MAAFDGLFIFFRGGTHGGHDGIALFNATQRYKVCESVRWNSLLRFLRFFVLVVLDYIRDIDYEHLPLLLCLSPRYAPSTLR